MGPYIVGFDTISYYVPTVCRWAHQGTDFWEFLGTAPLFYILVLSLASAGIPILVLFKVLPPILHGLLGYVTFLYATRSLAWPSCKALLASLLATLYFVGLRISWDMLRSELGLILLFIFLVVLQRHLASAKPSGPYALALLAALIALTHQLVSVVMFVMVFTTVLEGLTKQHHSLAGKTLLACLPAAMLFLLIFYADYVILPARVDEAATSGQSEWLRLMGASSISGMVVNAVGFSLFCYSPLLPFIVLGARSFADLRLKAWALWCLIGAQLPLLFASAPLSYRWILLMSFPLAFIAAEGFVKPGCNRLKAASISLATILSLGFIMLPAEVALPYFSLYPYYVPSSMLQNSVPLSDCEDVIKALNWLRDNASENNVLLVHDAFSGWATLYVSNVRIVRYGYASPENAALASLRHCHGQIYIIWWTSEKGWHGCTSLPSVFKEVYASRRIAIYRLASNGSVWTTA